MSVGDQEFSNQGHFCSTFGRNGFTSVEIVKLRRSLDCNSLQTCLKSSRRNYWRWSVFDSISWRRFRHARSHFDKVPKNARRRNVKSKEKFRKRRAMERESNISTSTQCHQHTISTHQHINTSYQHINTSTHQHSRQDSISTHQHINTSWKGFFCWVSVLSPSQTLTSPILTSTQHQHLINTSTQSSTYQHINTSTQHSNTIHHASNSSSEVTQRAMNKKDATAQKLYRPRVFKSIMVRLENILPQSWKLESGSANEQNSPLFEYSWLFQFNKIAMGLEGHGMVKSKYRHRWIG
jgi:hypothetical protein